MVIMYRNHQTMEWTRTSDNEYVPDVTGAGPRHVPVSLTSVMPMDHYGLGQAWAIARPARVWSMNFCMTEIQLIHVQLQLL